MSIDSTWPGGWGTAAQVVGQARDLLTPADGGAATVLRADVLHARIAADRTIEQISSEPARPVLGRLVGARGGGRLRSLLAEVVPDELATGSPLYLLLDDLSGASLVSAFAFFRWPDRLPVEIRTSTRTGRRMEGVCIGFSPGSAALNDDGTARMGHHVQEVATVDDANDVIGWHELPQTAGPAHRRARRVDVSVGDSVEIDAFFQDSASTPDGGRVAVHEYGITATADPVTFELLSVRAEPRVLPYDECPLAVGNIQRLVGRPLRELREAVLSELRGSEGCTHLNDMLRALAEVPQLARGLRTPRPAPLPDPKGTNLFI